MFEHDGYQQQHRHDHHDHASQSMEDPSTDTARRIANSYQAAHNPNNNIGCHRPEDLPTDAAHTNHNPPNNTNTYPMRFSPAEVLNRIDKITSSIIHTLDHISSDPILLPFNINNPIIRSMGNLSQCRSYASILLILSYVQTLLLSNRTSTNRELYYSFVTHFRSQKECDVIVVETANMLHVPRIAMGLIASPKGWYCGCIRIVNHTYAVTDGRNLSSVLGLPITREWIDRSHDNHHNTNFQLSSMDARCILVIEKEGLYARLSEDQFYDRYPCILITGKGFPDLATRAMVKVLYDEFHLPVYGLCDCNPYGLMVLRTYRKGSDGRVCDGGDAYSVPIQWIGLRPSQVERLRDMESLPYEVYQGLTEGDKRKIQSLLVSESERNGPDHKDGHGSLFCQELQAMERCGYKVELEALHWLGMDAALDWLENLLWTIEEELKQCDENGDGAKKFIFI